MVKTLEANYQTELVKEGRKRFYRVTKDGNVILDNAPGPTSILGIIGGEKTQRLIGWAKKEALGSARRELEAFGTNPINIQPEIEGIITRASKRPKDALQEAAATGTRLHAAADAYIKGKPIELTPDIENPFLAFKDWVKASGINIIMGDTSCASLKHKYGGSFDFVFEKDGKLGIGDFKTAGGFWDSFYLQIAAYSQAAKETFNENFPLGLIVRFDKEQPIYEVKEITDHAHAFQGFMAAMVLKSVLGELNANRD